MNEFDEKMQFYRQRKARNISIAVMGYFIGVVCIIGCTVMWGAPVFGVLLFLTIVAASTGLIIYTTMSTPPEFSGKYDEDYEYEDYRRDGDSANFDSGYSTREVSTDTNGTEGADGAAGAGFFGGQGGEGGGKASRRADPRYYTGRRVSPSVRMFKQIMEIFWLGVTIVYFVVSFFTGRWGITWLIWLIGAAVDRAIRILWEARRFDGPSDKR
ncbi:MAG: hypothetical protein J5747_09855 [Spirochaetaceae bacterium]|nr:hypothetical protein [Spirochaetaceae bacterium]